MQLAPDASPLVERAEAKRFSFTIRTRKLHDFRLSTDLASKQGARIDV